MALAICGVGFLGSAPASAADPLVVDDPVGAARLVVLANEERAAAGLAPLELRFDVFEIADAHSERMAVANDIFHNDGYFTPEVRQRLGARTLGENVAMNKNMDDAHARLMNSPGHRANLMNPKFTVIGMAVVRTADGMGFVTQDFVEPLAASASAPAPAPVPAPVPGPPPAAVPEPAPAPAPQAPAAEEPAPVPAPVPTAAPVQPAAVSDVVVPDVVVSAADVTAAAPTTTARATVSVVTEPISSSATPKGSGNDSHQLVFVSAAAIVLLVVAGSAIRALRR